jgi:hypothetical protein
VPFALDGGAMLALVVADLVPDAWKHTSHLSVVAGTAPGAVLMLAIGAALEVCAPWTPALAEAIVVTSGSGVLQPGGGGSGPAAPQHYQQVSCRRWLPGWSPRWGWSGAQSPCRPS